MKKNYLMLLAIVTLLLVLVTGCGKEKPDENNPDVTSGGYEFTYKNTAVRVDAEAAPIITALGEPINYFEAASCAFDGLDKIYDYGSFQINTYESDKKDYISMIVFKDDLVKTPEGISLFMTLDDMIASYGKNYIEDNGLYVYKKDSMKLCFIIEANEIVSIEYTSTFLEN